MIWFHLNLVGGELKTDQELSPPTLARVTGDDVESELSDVIDQGYCTPTQYNIRMSMRVEPVKKTKIKRLYNNIEKVSYSHVYKHYPDVNFSKLC